MRVSLLAVTRNIAVTGLICITADSDPSFLDSHNPMIMCGRLAVLVCGVVDVYCWAIC